MKKDNPKIRVISNNEKDFDLKGIKLSMQMGTVSDFWATKHIKNATLVKYTTNSDSFSAIAMGLADVFLAEKSYIVSMNRMSPGKYHIFEETLYKELTGAAFRKTDDSLRLEFNNFLKQWKEEGNYQKVYDKYFK